MNKLTKCAFSAQLALLISPISYGVMAQTDNPTSQEVIRLKHQQISQKSDEAIKKAEDYLSNSNSNFSQEKKSIDKQLPIIKEINIDTSGNRFSPDFSPVIKQYIGTNLTSEQVLSLIKDLTQILYDAGYVTSGIGLKSQEIYDGKLELITYWGKIESLYVNGNIPSSFKDKSMLLTVPTLKDEIFNIYDLDQMIEVMNTTNKRVSVNVLPSNKLSYSNLDLSIEREALPKFQLGINNSGVGNNQNGRNQITASLQISDILGINDSWLFSSGYRLYKHNRVNNQINYSVNYSQPLSWFLLNVNFSQSSHKKEVNGINGEYQTGGTTKIINLRLSKTIRRTKDSIYSIYGELDFKNKKSHLMNINIQNRNENKFILGASYITNFLSGKLFNEISYSNSLNWNNGDYLAFKNNKNKTLKIMNLNITWHKPFSLLDQIFNYQVRIGGQYSHYSLFSDNKLSIGDEYTVRGFKGGAVSGDNGIYLSQTFIKPINIGKYNFSPFIGGDIGRVYNKLDKRKTNISGIALGAKFNAKNLHISLTLSKPIKEINNDKKTIFYMNANLSF